MRSLSVLVAPGLYWVGLKGEVWLEAGLVGIVGLEWEEPLGLFSWAGLKAGGGGGGLVRTGSCRRCTQAIVDLRDSCPVRDSEGGDIGGKRGGGSVGTVEREWESFLAGDLAIVLGGREDDCFEFFFTGTGGGSFKSESLRVDPMVLSSSEDFLLAL